MRTTRSSSDRFSSGTRGPAYRARTADRSVPGKPKPPDSDRPSETPPETATEALERAGRHARRALGESLAAARALLDAAAIAWSGRPSEAHAALRGLADLLDQQSARLTDSKGDVPAPVMNAVLEALDHEIERWEQQAREDPDARAVLRTFLGLREILWEFGLRRDTPHEDAAPATRPRRPDARAGRAKPGSGPRRPGRVQRVEVKR